MSTQVLPSLIGLGFSRARKSRWSSRKPEAVSGKVTRIKDWSVPIYTWTLLYNVLRQGVGFYTAVDTFSELAQLLGFFDLRGGGFDSFLYADEDDNSASLQPLANTVTGLPTGDGSTTLFQLLRSFGGFTMPVLAPNVITQVRVNGTPTGAYTVNGWGTTNPGTINFSSPPGNGLSVDATFTYYFPCSFVDDECEFEKFIGKRYRVKKLVFQSIK